MLSRLESLGSKRTQDGPAGTPSTAPLAKTFRREGENTIDEDAVLPPASSAGDARRVQRSGRKGKSTAPFPRKPWQERGEETTGAAAAQGDLVIKSCLNSMQQLRLHHSLLMRTFIGPGEELEAILVEQKRVGDLYHEATTKKRGHGLGPPSIHKWAALIRSVCGLSVFEETLKAPLKEHLAYIELWKTGETDEQFNKRLAERQKELEMAVRHCKVDELTQGNLRITLHVREGIFSQAVSDLALALYSQEGWREETSTKPPTMLEMQLQKALGR